VEAVKEEKRPGQKKHACKNTDHPVGGMLARRNDVERDESDGDPRGHERQAEEHGLPAVDGRGALRAVIGESRMARWVGGEARHHEFGRGSHGRVFSPSTKMARGGAGGNGTSVKG